MGFTQQLGKKDLADAIKVILYITVLGFLATLLKQSTNQAVRFLVFEDTKNLTHKFIPVKFIADFLAGAFAGFMSVMVNNPLDVVKTNMQGLETHKFNGFLGCFAYIYKKEGIGGFYKGVVPRVARVCFDVALTFSLWSMVMRFFMWVKARNNTPKK